jgi:hypothetical protein
MLYSLYWLNHLEYSLSPSRHQYRSVLTQRTSIPDTEPFWSSVLAYYFYFLGFLLFKYQVSSSMTP